MYSILMSCPRLTGLNCAWQSSERIEESYRGEVREECAED